MDAAALSSDHQDAFRGGFVMPHHLSTLWPDARSVLSSRSWPHFFSLPAFLIRRNRRPTPSFITSRAARTAVSLGGPTLDASGNLYGTTFSGGNKSDCASGCGAVYKLTHHSSSWVLSPLYSFTGAGDGALPEYGAVTLGPDSAPYDTTSSGALDESGTIFNVRPRATACPTTICPWTENTVHQFGTGNDGLQPLGSVIFDAAGNLYGTTYLGGASGMGTVFEATRSGQNWDIERHR